MALKENLVQELKDTISVIGMLQERERVFRKELDFFITNCQEGQPSWIGPLKRLEHEAMFLCVDAYSLHEGISERSSLYSKIIKQHGKEFQKVDSRSTNNQNNVVHLGIVGDDGIRDASSDEISALIKASNKEAKSARKKQKEAVGIKSHKHSDMDNWMKDLIDKEVIEKLGKYRKDFAHRLNSLDNLKKETSVHTTSALLEMLNVVSTVLQQYKSSFQEILSYTTSTHFVGISNYRYDSIARIRQWKEVQPMLKVRSSYH